MDQKIRNILRDIYLIAPELRDQEEELKKTVEKLLSSKPERELDPGFKKELLDKILLEYGKPEARQQVKRAFYLRPAFITAAAASLLILVLGIILFLPKKVTKAPVTIATHDQAQKSDIRETKDPVKPPGVPPRQPVKTQPGRRQKNQQCANVPMCQSSTVPICRFADLQICRFLSPACVLAHRPRIYSCME